VPSAHHALSLGNNGVVQNVQVLAEGPMIEKPFKLIES